MIVVSVILALVAGTATTPVSNSRALEAAVAEMTIGTERIYNELGDTIIIVLRNELDHSIWFLDAERGGRNPWWGLQRLEEGSWTRLEIWKPISNHCVIVATERVPIEEMLQELKPGSEKTDQWTLETCEVRSSIGPKLEIKYVEPGVYRLFINFGFDKSSWENQTAFSKEFTVGGD